MERTVKSLNDIGIDFTILTKEDDPYIDHLNFELGGNSIDASMIKVFTGYGNHFDGSDTIRPIKLGSLGADFMAENITVIDFKNQYMQVYNQRPEWMSTLGHFESFDFKGRRIMLPVIINGKELELLYDSGCSAFGLITSKNRYDKYTDASTKEIDYTGNRWGDALPIHHKTTRSKLAIGGNELALKRISYVDMYAKYQKFMTPFTKIGGFLGNKPFTESAMIIDTKTEEFIIIESVSTTQKDKAH